MRSIEDIADEIVQREGGYVDNPNDPGGPTKFGVTIGTMRRLGIDLDGDGDVDREDVRALDAGRAREVFIRHYFHGPKIGDLPEAIQPSVFDMQVNAGANAIRILQRLLNEMGQEVSVDGVIGPQTAAAAALAQAQAPNHLRDAYGIARRNYYYRLGDKNRRLRVFARRRDGGKGGWILRAEEFVSPRYRLSPAEHKRRVSGWD